MNPFVAFEDGKGPLSYPLLEGTSILQLKGNKKISDILNLEPLVTLDKV
jgi:hypothetical protein